jgi:hypothetical protein
MRLSAFLGSHFVFISQLPRLGGVSLTGALGKPPHTFRIARLPCVNFVIHPQSALTAAMP